jgi:aerobic carbon-monoxide dehydrogenase large subunit
MLVRGAGRYTDDLNIPGQVYAAMVRSRHAHGHIRSIDVSAASQMEGVLGVFVAADLDAAGFGAIRCKFSTPNSDGSAMRAPLRPGLPGDRVRFVGEAVAFVVAETAFLARDAAELVDVDIEAIPAVVDAAGALVSEPIHPDFPENVVLDFHYGDSAAVDAAFARAAHRIAQTFVNNRIVVSPMEPRSAIGEYDPASGRWTLHTGTQGVFGVAQTLAKEILATDPKNVRVLTGNVGGSFGMKSQVYPEYLCVLHAARMLGRPVKWTDERSESFLSDHHGRSSEMTGELALDADGNFLALRLTGLGDIGAFPVGLQTFTRNAVRNMIGPYCTPLLDISTKAVLTNKTPVGSYRGAGRPEANYYMNRLIDIAAREIGVDPVELRHRNFIRPETIPYKTPGGALYDSGEFSTVCDKALALADWAGFPARKAASTARGKLRGRGICSYLETTGPQAKEMGGIRFEEDGSVTMITGTLDYGQGHASSFAQVLVERLGIPFERITLMQGDSDQLIAGGGTGGSKSMLASGAAFVAACDAVIERGRKLAGDVLEAAPADIEFRSGRFSVVGTGLGIDIMDLAAKTADADEAASLSVALVVDTPVSTYPNGCHVAEVEIDPETGMVQVVAYAMVNDFGVIINPMLVEGQAHGGVLQGIGQALCEETVYDSDGQLLTGSFTDYALPRALEAPPMRMGFHSVPATTNALGVKGCGEAGCAGALPSVMNAVVDALAPYGVRHMDMPVRPERVWDVIHNGSTVPPRP